MNRERAALGFEPVDVPSEDRGYDIESHDPASGCPRFIEVKGWSVSMQTSPDRTSGEFARRRPRTMKWASTERGSHLRWRLWRDSLEGLSAGGSGWDGAAGHDGLARYTDNRSGRYPRMEARQHGIAPVEGLSFASRPTTRATMARRDARPRRKSRQGSRELELPSRAAVCAADGGCSDVVLEAKTGVGRGAGRAEDRRQPPHVSTPPHAGGLRGRDER